MEPLKNLYTPELLHRLSELLETTYPAFQSQAFLAQIFDVQWEGRELKQRMRHITVVLHPHLPGSYEQSIDILMEVAPKCTGLPYLFFPDFVQMYGLEHWQKSMQAIECFTKYSTGEFAVRPFIEKNPEKMMKQMGEWSLHPNVHLRRLASEGCRPRLPWGGQLKGFQADPEPILPILDQLKQDEELYVRKSVANNLNDISKDHPSLVVDLAKRWYGRHTNTDWILKHGCRTLLKKRNMDALRLFGLDEPTGIHIHELSLSASYIELGEEVTFSFQLEVMEPRLLRLEYSIDFVKANGSTSSKLFRISEKRFNKGSFQISKKHRFMNLSTRKHYPGNHRISIWVNGENMGEVSLMLH